MEALTLAVLAASYILCFLVGARVGQKVRNGEPVELPRLDPVAAIREKQQRKEARYQEDRQRIIAENIENYNGTAFGQKNVPRR